MDKFFSAEKISDFVVTWAPRLVLAVVVLVIGLWVINWVTRMMRNSFTKKNMDPSAFRFLVSIISVVLKVLLILSIAGMFGVQTTSFIAIFGAAAFALGTGLSGNLSHFASGVMILMFKPYKVGDLVKLGDHTGHVEEIQTFNTLLRTLDNRLIYIPNSIVTGSPIINISGQKTMRADMQFSVGAGEDIDHVRSIILNELGNNPLVLKDPAATVNVKGLTPTSIDFDVFPWIESDHYWDAFFSINESVKKAFVKNKINGPKPGMDVLITQSNGN